MQVDRRLINQLHLYKISLMIVTDSVYIDPDYTSDNPTAHVAMKFVPFEPLSTLQTRSVHAWTQDDID